jgi:hypothetical protein
MHNWTVNDKAEMRSLLAMGANAGRGLCRVS